MLSRKRDSGTSACDRDAFVIMKDVNELMKSLVRNGIVFWHQKYLFLRFF